MIWAITAQMSGGKILVGLRDVRNYENYEN